MAKPLKLKSASRLKLSDCGRYLLTTRPQGPVCVYDLHLRRQVASFKPLKDVGALATVPHAPDQITVTSGNGNWVLMNFMTGDTLQKGQGVQSIFEPLQILSDGTQAAFAQRHMRLEHGQWVRYEVLELWDMLTAMPISERQIERQAGAIHRLDGDHFLMPAFDLHASHPGGHALMHWQGDPISAELKFVPPPLAQVTLEDGHWTEIRAMSITDGAPVLLARHASDTKQSVLVTLSAALEPMLAKTIDALDCRCIGGAHDVIALGTIQGALHFFERSTLDHIGVVHLADPHDLLIHPSGTGLSIAAGPNSIHHFDFEATANGVRNWLQTSGTKP